MTAIPLHYQCHSVPVSGGDLKVARWGETGPVVLAIHGITASHREFLALAEQLGNDVQLIAPDLRGRGASRMLPGPCGISVHADDMIAILNHFGIDKADIVLGHSMGGFVASVMGAKYPERCRAIVFVDGGLLFMPSIPFHKFPFIGEWIIEKITQKILGPSLNRLEMSFDSKAIYRDYWRDHPALKNAWSAYIEDYIDYDLYEQDGKFRPSTSREALMEDVRSELFEDIVPDSIKQLAGPVLFLRAEKGLMDDKPLYKKDGVIKAGKSINGFSLVDIEGSNHYTILLSETGAKRATTEIRKLLTTL